MRAVLLLTLVACGTEPAPPPSDPNERVTCQFDWRAGITACDRGCEVQNTPTDTTCTIAGAQCSSDTVVDFEGQRGCCTLGLQDGEMRIQFAACE